AVLEAAVRSFAPVEPLALRWEFPLWTPDTSVDAANLRGRLNRNEERQQQRNNEGKLATVKALRESPSTIRTLRSKTGFSHERQDNVLNLLTADGTVGYRENKVGGNKCREYYLKD